MTHKNNVIKKLLELMISNKSLSGNYLSSDVPHVIDDKEYKTYISLEQELQSILPPKKTRKFLYDLPEEDDVDDFQMISLDEIFDLMEQVVSKKDEENPQNEQVPVDQTQNQDMSYQDPSMVQDPNAMGGGYQDPSMMGMGYGPQQEPEKTAIQIGRIYELKKIYNRLLSIEEYLSFTNDSRLQKLRDYISKGIELFELLISNIDSFMKEDKSLVDSIVVLYYKFIIRIYLVLKQYYEDNEDTKNKNKQNK
jgi:hypothetical protein